MTKLTSLLIWNFRQNIYCRDMTTGFLHEVITVVKTPKSLMVTMYAMTLWVMRDQMRPVRQMKQMKFVT